MAESVPNMENFIDELNRFNTEAEETLESIESDLTRSQSHFRVFAEQMIAIRGMAVQLELPKIARFSELGEEIAIKAQEATKGAALRRSVGCLWDAVSTIRYLIKNQSILETPPEEAILTRRLEETLRIMGGPRPTITQDQIKKLLDQ